jgi:Ca-activated chloride channel homolog
MSRAPEDPNGDIRLVRLLVEAGQVEEALAHGRRLRDRGYLTLRLARQLGDVLARAGQAEEAVRTYSEIVEFDPESVASRRLLGDIYLGHGWYEPAYRQYKTTTDQAPDDALGWLRLANAAAGSGRVDEALRLQRKVASAPGRPGPTDPRGWARLLAAARLSELVQKPPAGQLEGVKRELKELQLFRGPATLVVLTWNDLQSDVQLVARLGDEDVGLGETTDGAAAGVSATLLGSADVGRAKLVARLRSEPRDDAIVLERHDIGWDGKDFQVKLSSVTLEPRKVQAEL